MKKPTQIEDMILKEVIKTALKITSFVLILLSSIVIAYLICENNALKKENKNQKNDFDSLVKVKLQEDSIIESMPEYLPKGWEIDSNGIANPNFTQND